MNEHGARLGMNNSNFTNSTGLPDPDHYTTPTDIAKVTAATIREFPEWYAWYAIKEYTYNNITINYISKNYLHVISRDGVAHVVAECLPRF